MESPGVPEYYDPIHLHYFVRLIRQDGSSWSMSDVQYVASAAACGRMELDGYASGSPESRPESVTAAITSLQSHESCLRGYFLNPPSHMTIPPKSWTAGSNKHIGPSPGRQSLHKASARNGC